MAVSLPYFLRGFVALERGGFARLQATSTATAIHPRGVLDFQVQMVVRGASFSSWLSPRHASIQDAAVPPQPAATRRNSDLLLFGTTVAPCQPAHSATTPEQGLRGPLIR